MKELVQGDEKDDDQFFLDTLFLGNIEKADDTFTRIHNSLTNM